MKKQLDNNLWKAITLSTMWLCVGAGTFSLGLYALGLVFAAFFVTLVVVGE